MIILLEIILKKSLCVLVHVCLKYLIYFLNSGSVVRVQKEDIVRHDILPDFKIKKIKRTTLQKQLAGTVFWESL